MPEHVVLFTGPMGAGKTTAISTLSDIPVVSTEALNNDRAQANKDTTTVALDYGEISLGPDDKVRLYGVPGQRRFDFMWSILAERALGLVILIHADAPSPADALIEQLDAFAELIARGGLVVGVSRIDRGGRDVVENLHLVTEQHSLPYPVPVFPVDPRDAAQMRMLLLTLLADLDSRSLTRGGTRDTR